MVDYVHFLTFQMPCMAYNFNHKLEPQNLSMHTHWFLVKLWGGKQWGSSYYKTRTCVQGEKKVAQTFAKNKGFDPWLQAS